jgi:hypothetical protein
MSLGTLSESPPGTSNGSLPNFQTLVVSRFREMGSSGPLSIQQLAIASSQPAEVVWSETFKPSPSTPPRGFSFTAIRHGKTLLLVYSVHFKSNRGEVKTNIAKREEAARQLLAHVAEMENASTRILQTPRFASERTFAILKEKFVWPWENLPLSERVTNPAKGRYPVGHLIRENNREGKKTRSVGQGRLGSPGAGFRGLRLRGRSKCRRPFFSPGEGAWGNARTERMGGQDLMIRGSCAELRRL